MYMSTVIFARPSIRESASSSKNFSDWSMGGWMGFLRAATAFHNAPIVDLETALDDHKTQCWRLFGVFEKIFRAQVRVWTAKGSWASYMPNWPVNHQSLSYCIYDSNSYCIRLQKRHWLMQPARSWMNTISKLDTVLSLARIRVYAWTLIFPEDCLLTGQSGQIEPLVTPHFLFPCQRYRATHCCSATLLYSFWHSQRTKVLFPVMILRYRQRQG